MTDDWDCHAMRVHCWSGGPDDLSLLLIKIATWIEETDGCVVISGIAVDHDDEGVSVTVTYSHL